MLGVRRATVSEAMAILQRAGAVDYKMGVIEVKDRARLEDMACECYAIVRSEFDRLVGGKQFVGENTANPLDRVESSRGGKTTVGDAVGPE
jgi:hypothetical protein